MPQSPLKSASVESDHSKRALVIRASRAAARALDTIFTSTLFKESRDRISSDLFLRKRRSVVAAHRYRCTRICICGMRILHPTVTFLLSWPPFARRENRNALLSYWPLYLIGNVDKMLDRVILSRLCHIFFQRVFSRDRVFGKRSETEYSDEMPTNPRFTWVVRGAYCILGFFDNSSVKLRLIRVRSFRPRRNSPRRKLHPDFRPDLRARLTLTVGFHCRDFHLRVSVLLSHTGWSNGPILPCSYLNSRSTLSQVLFRPFPVEGVYREL